MFTPKSLILLFVCPLATQASPQTFYHTSDVGGSYTRVSHGTSTHVDPGYSAPGPAPAPATTYHQPATTYHQPATTYHKPAPVPVTSYHSPAPATVSTFHAAASSYNKPKVAAYHQPAAPSYHQPAAPSYHQPAAPSYHQPVKATYGDKCHLDYKDEDVQICVPTLDSNCASEKTGNGVRITEEYDCKPITRTVCTEYEDYDQVEVCATSYSLQEVPTTAKLVQVVWVKECKDEIICKNPHAKGAYHADVYCKEQIKSVCYDSPVVKDVLREVVMKLPQPYEVCITKEIALPRVKCNQIVENKCSHRQRVQEPEQIYLDKCTVAFGQEQCHHSQIRLPVQGCLKTYKEIKNVYEEE